MVVAFPENKPGIVEYAFNTSVWEVEAEESLWDGGPSGLYRELQDS